MMCGPEPTIFLKGTIVSKVAALRQHRLEISDRRHRHDGLEQGWRHHRGLQRRITAIGPANDCELVRIGDALFDEPPTGIGDIADRDIPPLKALIPEP